MHAVYLERSLEVHEMMAQVAKSAGFPFRHIYLLAYLDIPAEQHAAEANLEMWEWEIYMACCHLIALKKVMVRGDESKRSKLKTSYKDSIQRVCTIIGHQILKGNFDAPRLVSEGLKNFEMGKSFRLRAGRKRSSDHEIVLTFFHAIKAHTKCEAPSQSEVAKQLARLGVTMKADRLSKIFDELGLKSLASDAREAQSDAGKRKRRKG